MCKMYSNTGIKKGTITWLLFRSTIAHAQVTTAWVYARERNGAIKIDCTYC